MTITGLVTDVIVSEEYLFGITTSTGGLRIGTGGTVGPVASGVVTYFGDGSNDWNYASTLSWFWIPKLYLPV